MVFRDSSKGFTHHKSMGAIDPPYVPRFDARGFINNIYVGNYFF